jgi:hypothetical protein
MNAVGTTIVYIIISIVIALIVSVVWTIIRRCCISRAFPRVRLLGDLSEGVLGSRMKLFVTEQLYTRKAVGIGMVKALLFFLQLSSEIAFPGSRGGTFDYLHLTQLSAKYIDGPECWWPGLDWFRVQQSLVMLLPSMVLIVFVLSGAISWVIVRILGSRMDAFWEAVTYLVCCRPCCPPDDLDATRTSPLIAGFAPVTDYKSLDEQRHAEELGNEELDQSPLFREELHHDHHHHHHHHRRHHHHHSSHHASNLDTMSSLDTVSNFEGVDNDDITPDFDDASTPLLTEDKLKQHVEAHLSAEYNADAVDALATCSSLATISTVAGSTVGAFQAPIVVGTGASINNDEHNNANSNNSGTTSITLPAPYQRPHDTMSDSLSQATTTRTTMTKAMMARSAAWRTWRQCGNILLFMLLLVYFQVSLSVYRSIDCNSDPYTHERYVAFAPNVPCTLSGPFLAIIIVGFITGVIGTPLLWLVLVIRYFSSLNALETRSWLGVLYGDYHKRFAWWMCVEALGYSSIAIVSTFCDGDACIVFWGTLMVLVFLLAHVYCRPHKLPLDDVAWGASYCATLLLLVWGRVGALAHYEDNASNVVIIGMFLFFMLMLLPISKPINVLLKAASMTIFPEGHGNNRISQAYLSSRKRSSSTVRSS